MAKSEKQPKKLTARERDCQRIAEEKARSKRRYTVMRRAKIGGGAGALLLAAGIGGWGWHSGALARNWHDANAAVWNATGRAGFRLHAVYIEGRDRTTLADINAALGLRRNEPILGLSLAELRQRLEHLDHVKFASVERSLPDTLHVHIVEREPVAQWQHKGKLTLVDEEGMVMNEADIAPYRHLPLLLGEGAPSQVKQLLAFLKEEPALLPHVKAAMWVGERRWNIRFDRDVEVRLPENDAASAWHTLGRIEQDEKILERDIRAIDLRTPDRIFIKLSPGAVQPPSKPTKTQAKET